MNKLIKRVVVGLFAMGLLLIGMAWETDVQADTAGEGAQEPSDGQTYLSTAEFTNY